MKKGNQPEYQTIFLQADKALYCAKNNGKNKFYIYNEAMHFQS